MSIDEFRKEIINDVDGFMNSYAIREFFFDDNMDYKAWLDLFNEYLEEDEGYSTKAIQRINKYLSTPTT